MPIRINLKELFASDAQEMFIDKTNFNFNKLLELGIGEAGIQGLTGGTGSAGPQGNEGDVGQRGNKWFVGNGDPNLQTFTGLILNDFYLDTVESSIWQYQGSPASWIEIADLSEVVTNLITAEGTPFVRGFGEFSPLDDRYILFTKRGNDIADITADISLGNVANNDILLLTNWNERESTITNFPADTSDEYNALQNISLDHTIVSGLGRYHLELSSLYDDPISPGDKLLSSLNHNLKVRYVKDTSGSITYPLSNKFINTARFSLSVPETISVTNIEEQGIFEFVVPKYNIDTGIPSENFNINFGTTEALSKNSFLDIVPDGIEASTSVSQQAISIGLIKGLEDFNSILTLNTNLYGDFGMINSTDNLNGLIIKGDTYSTGGSLTHIQTDSNYSSTNINYFSASKSTAAGMQGVCSTGKYLFMVSPQDPGSDGSTDGSEDYLDDGHLWIYDISNIEDTKLLLSYTANSQLITKGGYIAAYDNHGNPNGDGPYPGYVQNAINPAEFRGPFLTGVRDIAFKGKYGVIVRHRPTASGGVPNDAFFDSFQIFEINSDGSEINQLSWLGTSITFSNFMTGSVFAGVSIPEMNYLRRVEIHGNYAFCMSSEGPAGSTTKSELMAVDITNVTRPFIDWTYIKNGFANQFIDFDIENETAYILSHVWISGTNYEVRLLKLDISNPTSLSTAMINVQTIDPGPIPYALLPLSGGIKAIGKRLYIASGGKFEIWDTYNRVDGPAVLIYSLPITGVQQMTDIEIKGDYAYIYAQDSASEQSILITVDISDETLPVVINPIQVFPAGNGSMLPSKMTMVGNKIFTISASDTAFINKGGSSVINVPGIKSSAGNIGSLRSDSINVTDSIDIGKTLNVGNSAIIGHGGLWVDKGNGINTDGIITSNMATDSSSPATPFRIGFRALDIGFPGLAFNSSFGFISSMNESNTFLHKHFQATGLNSTVVSQETAFDADLTGITSGFPNAIRGIYIVGEDYNYLSGDLEIGGDLEVSGRTTVEHVDGANIHYSGGIYYAAPNIDVIKSGDIDDYTSNGTLRRLTFSKVGARITVSGYWDRSSSNQFYLPVQPQGLFTISDIAGVANSASGTAHAVSNSGSNALVNGTLAATNYWFQISYLIT